MEDRPYQSKAEEAVINSYDAGWRQLLIAMATGTGKTVVFSKLFEKLQSRLPGKMLVLAHREELIDQAIEKIKAANPTLRVDKEMAEHHADPAQADVVVASVATLGRKGTKRLEKYNWDDFDKIITDEAHHSTAQSYRNIYDVTGVLKPSTNKLLVGFSATPFRSDGQALAEVYKNIPFVYSLRQAIEDGYLVDIRGYRVSTKTSLAEVKSYNGDFAVTDLATAVNTETRNKQIVAAWIGCDCSTRKTIVFAANIEHSKALADEFTKAGFKAAAVWGADPERAQKMLAHKNGDIQVLVNCNVATEGYDDPSITCVILARPTTSPVLYTQMIGRGTRLYFGKTDVAVIDVVDITSHQSLVTVPTLLGLNAELNLMGESLLKSAQALEKAKEEYETADFSKLQNIHDLETFIQQIDLFEVKFPKEVEQSSDLRWFEAVDGGYRINIPKESGGKPDYIHIQKNLLDQWEINGYIKERGIHGIRPTLEEAFAAADGAILQRVTIQTLSLLKRKAAWHDKPVKQTQLDLLKRLYPYKQIPETITRGQAAHMIDQRLSKWRKK